MQSLTPAKSLKSMELHGVSIPPFKMHAIHYIINPPYRFPGQECTAGDSKIPSIMYYHQDGSVHSSGAEAALPGIALEAEDNELIFVEWFVEYGDAYLLLAVWADVHPGESSYTFVRRG